MAEGLIKDSQEFVGARTRFGNNIRTYDDGFSPLWILRDSMGIQGVVRAQTLEDAYGICEDEIFPSADKNDVAGFEKEYGKDWSEDACWQEQYGFRPNGAREIGGAGIYVRDLNGESLEPLTFKLLTELEISLDISDE